MSTLELSEIQPLHQCYVNTSQP